MVSRRRKNSGSGISVFTISYGYPATRVKCDESPMVPS